jgi:hypothetical protein
MTLEQKVEQLELVVAEIAVDLDQHTALHKKHSFSYDKLQMLLHNRAIASSFLFRDKLN